MEADLEEEQTHTLRCQPPEFLDEDWEANLARMPPAEVECMCKAVSATSPVHEFVQDQFVANEVEAGLEGEAEDEMSVVGV